ncbi:epiplakin isoform X3 [Xenopus tropicalis]|uniref:Epiplakin isoform X3 n=1 Tax=Xenopus tropicalis TaxID=8364 RepID=A0A8J1JR92_XENTR|nr:epiplakin isoform X3 [Xenopus tropicalis]
MWVSVGQVAALLGGARRGGAGLSGIYRAVGLTVGSRGRSLSVRPLCLCPRLCRPHPHLPHRPPTYRPFRVLGTYMSNMEHKISQTVTRSVVTRTVVHSAGTAQTRVVQSSQSSHSAQHLRELQASGPTKVSPSIAGFFVEKTKEKISIYQALQEKLVTSEVALSLLEAQAATGNILDPKSNQKLSVEAAIGQGIVGPEFQEKLLFANKAVTGHRHKDGTLSLFQAFKKGQINQPNTVRLLGAQLATGGIISPSDGQRVSLAEAIKLNLIDEEMASMFSKNSDSVKCYLDPNTQEAATYQQLLAKCTTDTESGLALLALQGTLQGLRKPVTAEQLLRANIINQALYDDIRQGKERLENVGERHEVKQCLHGLGSIGGIYVESTKEKISIYQAMKKNILSSHVAASLLEAQAASGFIIDPVSNRTFTVTEAIKEELIGLELKEKLLSAERSVTGFSDPYTDSRISLFQAIKKELIDKNLGMNLLQVQKATGGFIDPVNSFHVPVEVAYQQGLLDEEMNRLLSDPLNGPKGFLDPNTNDAVTYAELKKRCIVDPETKVFFFPVKLTFQGIRGKVTADELLDSLIIDRETFENLQQGRTSDKEVADRELVRQYLEGTGCIAGVVIVSSSETKSLYQAMKEHYLMSGTSIALLEAQAATGGLIDPIKNLKFSVDEAVKNGLAGPELYEKLLSAEKATTGYRDPYNGQKVSLFQAIKGGFVERHHGIQLLEVQMATGGIIDPLHKHRVPKEVAYKRGLFDDDMNKNILAMMEEPKGYFDPNLKVNINYGQMLHKCLVDLATGLYLLPIFDQTQQTCPNTLIDFQTTMTLKAAKIPVTSGKYKAQTVSIWELLFSDYFTTEERISLVYRFKCQTVTLEGLSNQINTNIQQIVSSTKISFEGLRERVTPKQLLNSDIIDKTLYEKLEQGEASVKDVVNMDTVKKYLQGTGCIGGLILTETQEKMSIYQAKRKALLRPGTSLILLEAQAATGFIIDPVENKKYSVEEALKANVIGPEFYEKLLSAEKSVTGYIDPYTEKTISLFQAMSKGLIVKEHGIRLLEAQIASGGIIDPINSHRIPVEVAYKRGYFDKKMNLILSDPSDDTKGFFDPNTNENLTYLQLKEKCITEPTTNLCLLPLRGKKSLVSINDSVKASLSNLEIYVRYGRFRQKTVSAWVLINSEYFSEWKRRYIVEQYRLQKKTLKEIAILIEEEMNKWTDIRFPALRGQVNIHQLLEYEIIDKELFQQVLDGKVKVEDVMKTEKVQRHLHGSDILGGVILQPSNQRISFLEATKKRILLPSTVLPILEAQAATGHIIDPISNQKLTVDEALKAGVIDPQHYDKLLTAEEAVTGYKDPFTGRRISLYQAMRKGLVDEKHAIQLLDAQLATGGIIDPDTALHLPVSVANKHGFFNDELHQSLSTDALNSYCDPTTKQMVSYSELVSRSEQDKPAGIRLIPLPEGFTEVPTDNIFSEEEVKETFKNTRIEERNTTLWVLIHYGYFTEEQRSQILERYKLKKATLQEVTTEILQFIKDNEIKMTTHISFEGLRGKVPAIRLLDLGILNQTVFNELLQGLKTTEEVSKLESVKKYLQGTGYISGVFLQSTKEKMSIYQAMKRNLIMPANGLLFLEAQAATGFLIDPVYNQKYSVDSAVKAGVVGPELHEKLLTAESAVTGFLDPYTGNKISLLQAIGKDLLLRNEAIPLLQAQIAAGGIVDPNHCHYVPLEMAHKLGFLDEEVDVAKSTISLKAFYDPDTKENLSYMELKDKCYKDPETGLLLLPLSESAAIYADENIISVLKSVTVNVQAGRFKGQVVSVWELLNSEYISVSKLKELLALYSKSSAEALQLLIQTVTTIIIESEKESKKIHFKGLRRQVSASDLFLSEVIDKQTLDDLNLGKKTITEVTEMDNVKRYLEGTNCIAGVLVQATNKKMSIYEAMLKGILRPGTALVLLEAQAATGFIVDPVKNMKLSVDEALGCRLIGQEIYKKLLSAEQAVTGYTDPHNEEKISLFQAMNKKLIVESHGIRLLEAQIATGGIIDPVHSHRIPVDTAYKRGYFNEEMNTILSDPSDDTKGFFDPNTHENLTYLQLVERCIQDPETGLYLLQVVKKGENYFYITDKIKEDLQSKRVLMHHGSFTNQTVSLWEILSSHYVTDLKRRELVRLYIEGVMTEEHLLSSVTTLIMDYESKSNILMFKGIRGEVSATELFNAEIIDKKTLDDLRAGKKTVEDIAQVDSIKTYLEGTGCIAGAFVLPDNEKLSVYEAIKKGILPNDIGLTLLEAQVATGFLIDPVKNKRLSVSEALSAGLIGTDVQNKLELAEQAVTGFTDPDSGNKLSLFQAIKKGLINRDQGLYLLEAQLCTGGVINPLYSHRVPLGAAYKKGLLDEDTYILLSDGKKGFTDPNTHERISYKNLMERCTKDTTTGLDLLQLAKKRDDYFYIDNPTKNILTSTPLKMHAGKFQGQDVSLWDILCSIYISEEKRKELIKKYKSETTATLKSIIATILSIIEKKETTQSDIWFQGLRKQVTASELYSAGIINKETLEGLKQEPHTITDVAQNESVKKFLEGTSCIAGLLVPSLENPAIKVKMNIYNAMLKRILRPGTALVLLEAQAATGFIIDSIKNKKLSVDEAFEAGLIGYEIYEKLLCAEKAVTGYTDPYTGSKISLFQAMKADLIVKEHGIRVLEAQIATGGIIDPVHSHRVPVEVAYKRGYFDEEMNQILSDPTDDTKGFFDPNTHENLTYMQLIKRCVQDPETKLYMLEIHGSKPSPGNVQSALRQKTVEVTTGQFQGRKVSIWDLIHSQYISPEKRDDLLKKFTSGTLSIEELMEIIITMIYETEATALPTDTIDAVKQDEQIITLFLSEKVDVTMGDFRGKSVSLWEILNSHYISEEKRKELIDKMKVGSTTMEEIIAIVITIITETELQKGTQVPQIVRFDQWVQDNDIQEALKRISINVTKGQFQGQEFSIWDLLQSKSIPEETRLELLGDYRLTIEEIIKGVVQSVKDTEIGSCTYDLHDEVFNVLQTVKTDVTVGEFKGQKYSVWELLNSKYFSEDKKKELLENFNLGTINIHELIQIITTIIEEMEENTRRLKFKGLRRQVTATELLTSEIIDQDTLRELAQGKKTVEEVTEMDTVKRYLEGESCIAGILVPSAKEPSQKDKMSIYNAMQKNILRPGTALVLLEAQAATGFVIDPINNKKLSVDEAVAAGVIGKELHGKLLSAERAVTGYKDPYTGDKVSLFQAMQKELIVKDHGIRLLEAQIATGGIIDPLHSHRVPVDIAYKRGYFDEEMNQILSDPSDDTKGFFDPNTHENLTYMQLLQRCIKDSDTGLCLLEVSKAKSTHFKAETNFESRLKSLTVHLKIGHYQGQNVSLWELLNSHYFSEEKRQELLLKYKTGAITINELQTIVITTTEELESKKTGHLNGSVHEELDQKTVLSSAFVQVTKGKFMGQKISIWELLNSEYITEEKRKEILQKYSSGAWTMEEIITLITTIIAEVEENREKLEKEKQSTSESLHSTTGTDKQLQQALDVITVSVPAGEFQKEKISLWEILHTKYISSDKRNSLLNKHQVTVETLKGDIMKLIGEKEVKGDEEVKQTLELKFMDVRVGKFKGQQVSLWVLLHSKYISEEKRKELLEKYKSGTLTLEEMFRIIITIIEETEEKSHNIKFTGLRRQVTATELLESQIIDQSTMNELTQGSRTVEQVTQMDSVKRYLQGTSPIAGVFVTSKKEGSQREKMTIYDAMFRRILRPGTALVLLEAQAATGFVVDPIQNRRLSVEEAKNAGLIGHEIYNKLLSAERGVTGYTDPYTGNKISLFQAMKKELIVKDHGIRLLEAQIATGGIIDPVHSHRVPVEVAYKRGYFDEEMNQILSDPSDDTKGFFDPNTHENLTYMQLLQRCVEDPETGMFMLDVKDTKPALVRTDYTSALQSKTVLIQSGEFQGKNVSVWELLHSHYISKEKREELLKKYSSGSLSATDLEALILTIISETERERVVDVTKEDPKIHTTLKSVTIDISVGSFQTKTTTIWDLLQSDYFSERERNDLLEKLHAGTLTLEEIIKFIVTVVTEKETKTLQSVTTTTQIKREEVVQKSIDLSQWPPEEQLQKALEAIPYEVSRQQNLGEKQDSESIWGVLQSEKLPDDQRKELLKTCKDTVQDVLIGCIRLIQGEGQFSAETFSIDEQTQKLLQNTTMEISVGEFKGQNLSLWDLLLSKYISAEKRKEILMAYLTGSSSIQDIIRMITTIIEETEDRTSKLMFQGLRQQVTAAELLSSEIIDQKTLDDLSKGNKTLEEITQMDSVKRYLEGTSCIAGVFAPSKKHPSKMEKMSIYQAMRKNILRPGTALVLLEAQAATGFIIDPVNNRKLSVDEAVSSGVVGKELHAKLLSAERAVTGYRDPYSGDKISLFQAMKKNLIVKDHGVRLLEAQIATGGVIDPVYSHRVPVSVAYKRGYFDEEMNQVLCDPSDDTKGFFDPNTHENLTYMQLVQRCVQDPDTGLNMLEVKDVKSPLFQIDKTIQSSLQSQTMDIKVGQYKGQNVSVWELLTSRYLCEADKERQDLLMKYKSGAITIQKLMAELVLLVEKLEEKRSSSNVAQHFSEGDTDKEKHSFLQSVEVEVTAGHLKGQKSSLWQFLNSSYITAEKRNELLIKYESGALTLEQLVQSVLAIMAEAEKTVINGSDGASVGESGKAGAVIQSLSHFSTFFSIGEFQGPSVSLWDILHSKTISRAERDNMLKKYLLTIEEVIAVLSKFFPSSKGQSAEQYGQTASFLKSVTVQVAIGEFKVEGKAHSLWELLHSKYITQEKRNKLIEKFESKTLTWEEIFQIIVTIIKETEERGRQLKFKGLRKQVSASELLQSQIIDQDTLIDLTLGKKTLAEVTEMDSVRRYLEGTSCIAGVLVTSKTDPSKKEKMSIYTAMLKGILRPGTALVLLEAQAATGFVIDPIKNIKLSVDEAAASGVIGQELHSKLLSAEKAVTGYNDPSTSQKISLFQAMQKELIVQHHGIRLLEAQIATGGIIDPVHSHRVPVEVAYKRGYFDEEMNKILDDPTDDTKGFFDPNTHENLTYMQLLQRCVQDPDTGLFMLGVSTK